MNRLAGKAAKVLALTLMTMLCLTLTAFAAEGDPLVVGIGKTTGSSLRLRSNPSLDASIITMLNKDWTIAVLGEADGWYHVAHNGDDGYVSAEFFTLSEETEFEYYGRINARGVNVRAESNIDSEIVNNLGLGSGVTVTGIENGWYHITGTYGEGWVRSDYISLTNETPLTPGASAGDSGIVDFARRLKALGSVEAIDEPTMAEAKRLGFSDFQIARLVENPDGNMENESKRVRQHRISLGVTPKVCRINTVASEHPDRTNYLYVTYGPAANPRRYTGLPSHSVVTLGSGAYRIGSSVEFDWCSVNAASTCRKLGYEAVMINYNPETVSTDYDMCDRLYFDELSFERVMDIIELERPHGVIVSVGGQIPNNLAMKLYRNDVAVLGTSPVSIDRAENRHKFSAMLDQLGIDQPRWKELTTDEEIDDFVREVGFPVLIRPSYVLSGAAMNVCYDHEQMHRFLGAAAKVSKEFPVVVTEFLQNAKEIEFDAVAQNGRIVEYAISEHVEFAGVHSGDATLVFPAQKIYMATARRIKRISARIAKELNISGPFNIQYLAKDNDVKVIECNLRASRSFPFVSKVLKKNFIDTATRIMLGENVGQVDTSTFDIDYIGVKASQFSFGRLHKADPVLGVDMSSTGEVGCIGKDFDEALLTAMLAVGQSAPKEAVLVSSGDVRGKVDMLEACRMLDDAGLKIYATEGTARFLNENGVEAVAVGWPDEDGADNVLDLIANHKVDLIINIPKNHTKRELTNGYRIRRGAVDHNIPLLTNARLASAFVKAFLAKGADKIGITPWQDYGKQ